MDKKTYGLFFLLLIYIFTIMAGYLFLGKITDLLLPKFHSLYPNNTVQEQNYFLLFTIFLANVFSTIIMWLIGLFCGTASVYDPYWSVQTPVIYIYLLNKTGFYNFGNIVYLLLILFWAFRLTYNFCLEFSDLSYVDWRYKLIKKNTGIFYPIVDLAGICLVPTIIVYIASIPSFMYILEKYEFSEYNILGFLLMVCATCVEAKADNEMRLFRSIRKSREQIMNIGLWKKSRHPNYFGEICFWYGVGTVYILPDVKENLKYIIGELLMNGLFLVISIPLAEGNLSRNKKGFEKYKKDTNMLIPL